MSSVRRALACLGIAAVAVTGCSGGGSSSVDPRTLVGQAKATLDATPGLHFTLTSEHTPTKGTVLVGGTGAVGRPSGFTGTLKVQRSGLLLSVEVVSLNGQVLVKSPFTNKLEPTDPHEYGFSDPGKLLDPNTGISRLLAELTSVTSGGRDRFNGEKLTEVNVTLPGTAVANILTSADKTQPVTGKLGIDP